MRRRRSEVSTFNLSMLDVMACGLGAMVLLFVATVVQIRQRFLGLDVESKLTATTAPEALTEEDLRALRSEVAELEHRLAAREQQRLAAARAAERAELLAEEAKESREDLAARRDRLAALVAKIEQPPTGTVDPRLPPVTVGALGAEFAPELRDGEARLRLIADGFFAGGSFDQCLKSAGIGERSVIVLSVDGRPLQDPRTLRDELVRRDPTAGIDLRVEAEGRIRDLHVPLEGVQVFEDEVLPLPVAGRRLLVVTQADPYLGRLAAAAVSRILRWGKGFESARVVVLGDRLREVGATKTEEVPRAEFDPLVANLLVACEMTPEQKVLLLPSAGLEKLLTGVELRPDDLVLFVLCACPSDPEAELERLLRVCRERRFRLYSVAIRGRDSKGLASFLATLAEQTGGGLVTVVH